ncbi:MAG TPA: TrkA C-terminal domain-containing protein [Aldersonia sp.]
MKRRGAEFTDATPNTVVAEGDLLIVAGSVEQVDQFAEMT